MITNNKEWLIKRLEQIKKELNCIKHDYQDRIKLIDKIIDELRGKDGRNK